MAEPSLNHLVVSLPHRRSASGGAGLAAAPPAIPDCDPSHSFRGTLLFTLALPRALWPSRSPWYTLMAA